MKYSLIPSVLALACTLAFAQGTPQPAPPDRFQEQMRTMQEMHQRMQAARTPAERQALMAEHMKVMQSGMDMMSRMGEGPPAGNPPTAPGATPGMGGMGGMGGMMAMHANMEQRMALMEKMMQMMVDREATMPRQQP
jgi:hypothetical protein